MSVPRSLSALPRALLVLAVVCALAFGALVAAPARADSGDINAAARAVVRVVIVQRNAEGYDVIGHGTGFAVSPTLIVTNAHVVGPVLEDESLRIGVVPAQGRSGYFARIRRVSGKIDLALIELTENATLPVATLYTGTVEDGSDVYAVGYPANVDQAQGLGLTGLVRPQAPVKSRGQVSGGRSSTQFDTLLHTAPIGTGNSGGPLLDACGRVVGVNSFGTISDNGSDSEFYFAVSMRELGPFLREAGVAAQTNAQSCQSLSQFDDDERARQMRDAAASQALSEKRAAAQRQKAERAARRAELEALDQRETLVGLAGLMLVMLVLGAAAGVHFYDKDRREQALASAIFAALCLGGMFAAWFARPSVAEILDRSDRAERTVLAESAAVTPADSLIDKGRFVCRFQPDRSRVTVSNSQSVALDWSPDGCVNGRHQYGQSAPAAQGVVPGWSRVLVAEREQTVSVSRYDPATRLYGIDRYLVDLPTMEAVRKARGQYQAPACGAGAEAARQLGEDQEAIRALLPKAPNERLVFACDPAPTTAGKAAPGLPEAE